MNKTTKDMITYAVSQVKYWELAEHAFETVQNSFQHSYVDEEVERACRTIYKNIIVEMNKVHRTFNGEVPSFWFDEDEQNVRQLIDEIKEEE